MRSIQVTVPSDHFACLFPRSVFERDILPTCPPSVKRYYEQYGMNAIVFKMLEGSSIKNQVINWAEFRDQ